MTFNIYDIVKFSPILAHERYTIVYISEPPKEDGTYTVKTIDSKIALMKSTWDFTVKDIEDRFIIEYLGNKEKNPEYFLWEC